MEAPHRWDVVGVWGTRMATRLEAMGSWRESWPCSGDEMGHSGGWLGKEKKALSYQLALRKQG